MSANIMPFGAGLVIFESGEKNLLAGAPGRYRFSEKAIRNLKEGSQGKFHQI
jgi:hypothetical protein